MREKREWWLSVGLCLLTILLLVASACILLEPKQLTPLRDAVYVSTETPR
ncbi:MAG: hypothetical protein RSJ41_11255 [Clostridia bacterium]